jgi:ketosteroid isomerase-like protein
MADIIERYLDAIASHDWAALEGCIADDIIRVGPYGDRYVGRDDYVAFIADLMPRLKGYRMEVHRITYASDVLAFAELTETVDADGKPFRTPEVLVFAVDGDRGIARVDIFIQTPQG